MSRQERSRSALYLTSAWPWPATTGGLHRSASIAAALEHVVPVTVLALDHEDERFPMWSSGVRAMDRRGRRARIKSFASAIVLGRGASLQRSIEVGMIDAFRAVLDEEGPGTVVLGSGCYGGFIDAAREAGARVIIDAGESAVRSMRSIALSPALPKRARIFAALNALSLGRLERREYPRGDELWVASAVDAEVLRRIRRVPLVRVVPNAPPLNLESAGDHDGEIVAVAFVGSYGHPPNVEAAVELIRDVMPRVRARHGPPRLTLIGRDPTPQILAMAAADPEVLVTGPVEHIAPPLRAAGLMAMPIRTGAGTRIKILEAAALGVPMVSTRFGAESLEFRDGEEILYAETADEFADAIVRLASDPELRRRISAGARRVVEERHSQAAVNRAVVESLSE